jgi:hypothetical protein
MYACMNKWIKSKRISGLEQKADVLEHGDEDRKKKKLKKPTWNM